MNKFITLMAVLRRKAYLPAVALLALLSGLAAKADVVIDATNFPDENFRNELLNKIPGRDGVFTDAEIANMTDLYISSGNIVSLQGIEHFTALQKLTCRQNKLNTIDVSKNTALQHLDLWMNKIGYIDVSKNTALTYLHLSNNNLSSIDVSKNTALTYLDVHSNNLETLDLSNNTALEELQCGYNKFRSLNLRHNTALKVLQCMNCDLYALGLSQYNPEIVAIQCSGNTNLKQLNLTHFPKLEELYCNDTQVTTLDLSNNPLLKTLYCIGSGVTSLDVSNNTALEGLYCHTNQLTTLDLSNNTALKWLWAQNNQLTELDLTNNTAIGGPNYSNQTRTLTAESALTPEGERFYYLRLDDNLDGDKSIVERMTETNLGGVASQFDPSRVLEWTAGGTIVNGQKRVILNADDMNPQTVKGKILVLTDVSENYTTRTASGSVSYKYNVNNPSDPNGVSGDFTLNWTAPMPEGSTSGPTALELNKKGIRLQVTQSHQLEVVTPDAGEITWTSDNPEAVEVDSTGRVTALKNGIAIITATAANGSSTWCCVVSYLLGDLNEDDKVDISDLNTEVSIVLGN